jgi:hypothetical protein
MYDPLGGICARAAVGVASAAASKSAAAPQP